MKKILLYTTLLFGLSSVTIAQNKLWTMEECMQYAVEHSPAVKQKVYTSDTYKADQTKAIASFFPSLEAGVYAEYNFGRAINPETNTYTNTTTFNNYYQGRANLPLFYGGQLVNQFRLAKSNRQMGMNDVQKAKDDLALSTIEAFVNVVYYQGTVQFAKEKSEESNRTLYKTRRQEELGVKGRADVALIEAQAAEDDYNLTQQENLYTTSILKLKEFMNYPYDEELVIDTTAIIPDYLPSDESAEDIFNLAKENNPMALQAAFKLKESKFNHLIAKGKLFPSISMSAGINTSYYEDLKSETAPVAFRTQFKNNRGEYISFSLSIPIFDRLSTITEIRRTRNSLKIAREQETEVLWQLQSAIEQSIADRKGFAKESILMEKKLNSDEIAYKVTLRKFEEGLMSPIELQTSANILIQSKANLLQKQLMYLLKCKQVDYYKGKPLIVEK